jgi:tetratricopeptide (TPR) repeat protein
MLQAILRSSGAVRALVRLDVRSAMRRARRARQVEDWAAVAAHYQSVLHAEPGWSAMWVRLAKAQTRCRDYVAAEGSYRQALAIDDTRADVHHALGNILKGQHRFVEAASSYFRAVQLDTKSPARAGLLALGYRASDIDSALDGGVLPAAPLDAIAAADRARAAANWSEAATHLAKAARARPDVAGIWVQLGHAQKEQGDFGAAEESYYRALAIKPNAADIHLQLGHLFKLQRRFAEATASYWRAVQIEPGSPARRELMTFGYPAAALDAALRDASPLPAPPLQHLDAAERARAAGNWSDAAAHFAAAVRTCPDLAPIWVQLGHAQKEQGDYAAAETSYRRALTIEPDLADTHLQLGHLLKLQARLTDAADSYFAAVRLAPAARDGLYARRELVEFGYRNVAIGEALATGVLSRPPAETADVRSPALVLNMIGAAFRPVDEHGQRLPTLVRHPIRLPNRPIGLFVDVQQPGDRTSPLVLEPSVATAAGELSMSAVPNSHGHHISTFRLDAELEGDAEFVLRGVLPASAVIRRIEIADADNGSGWPEIWPVPIRSEGLGELPTDQVRNFIIGTTGVCNANCPHCPTNKLMPSAQTAGEMSMTLFHSLVDQLQQQRVFVTGHISLGLFGDGLLDRHVVERATRLRDAFPHAPLHVNTNAAAYNRARHAALGSIIDIMAVHVETLDEEKYARLMAPLRLANVLPKVNQIIEDMARLVHIASPVHRANVEDLAEMRAYFAERGVSKTIFTPISNRCSRDDEFQKLAFGAKSGSCPEGIIFDLIVDWDGTVLICCNDFLRQEPIGKLGEAPLAEILLGAKRQRVFDALRTGRWQELETCRNCKFDCGCPEIAA